MFVRFRRCTVFLLPLSKVHPIPLSRTKEGIRETWVTSSIHFALFFCCENSLIVFTSCENSTDYGMRAWNIHLRTLLWSHRWHQKSNFGRTHRKLSWYLLRMTVVVMWTRTWPLVRFWRTTSTPQPRVSCWTFARRMWATRYRTLSFSKQKSS